MADILSTYPTLSDQILAPYEARAASLSREDKANRRRALAYGDELNLIQGVVPGQAVDRLGRLWCAGQITREEYFDLLGQLGRAGLLNSKEAPERA